MIDDKLLFYPDIYGKDTMMERLLYGDAIAPVVIEPEKTKEKKKTTAKTDSLKHNETKKKPPSKKKVKKK